MTVDRLRELREVGVIAIHHLELELLEPLDHVAPNDDIDLVERDLDQRPRRGGTPACGAADGSVTTSTSGASPASSSTSDRAV